MSEDQNDPAIKDMQTATSKNQNIKIIVLYVAMVVLVYMNLVQFDEIQKYQQTHQQLIHNEKVLQAEIFAIIITIRKMYLEQHGYRIENHKNKKHKDLYI